MGSTDTAAPTVSIGMPVYNGANHVAEAIDSILAQTFTDFELVITDNASTDETETICRGYAARDSRIRYHRNPTNLGAAANYDRAYHLTRGRYFRWHAHDDLIAPEYLERTVAALDDDPGCVLAHCRTLAIGPTGRVFLGFVDTMYTRGDDPAERLANWMIPSLRGAWTPYRANSHFCGLIRREVMERTPLHGDYPGSDDVFLGALLLLGRCCFVPEPLFSKRFHVEGYSLAKTDARARAAWFSAKRPRWPMMRNWRTLLGYRRALAGSGLTGQARREVGRVFWRGMWIARWRLLGELAWPVYFNGNLTRLGRKVVPQRLQERPTAEQVLADALRSAD